jgi:tetrapyrrole methylase family protein / MazG family protein
MPFSLDAVFATLDIDPLAEGVQVVAAAQILPAEPFSPLLPLATTRPVLICGLADATAMQRVQTALLAVYPAAHPMTLISGQRAAMMTLADLGQAAPATDLCAYLPAQPILEAVRSFDALRQITARLRAPDGCPWDRQQTHESLKPFVLEETYEVLEALDTGNLPELCEELGDLMMQVMIHSQVAVENGEFTVEDVLASISSKLIRRHPHVFGDVQVSGAQDVLRNWQSIKQAEKPANGSETPPSLLGGVPAQLPALAYAQGMQERAARLGFMRPTPDVLSRVAAATEATLGARTSDEKTAAYGDLLFALVQMGRWLGVDAEEALRLANRRYRLQFLAVEELCRRRGWDMQTLNDEKRQSLWRDAAGTGKSETQPA